MSKVSCVAALDISSPPPPAIALHVSIIGCYFSLCQSLPFQDVHIYCKWDLLTFACVFFKYLYLNLFMSLWSG